jgi:uncharacterized protein (TIGR00251 family)
MPPCVKLAGPRVLLDIKAQAGASKTEIAGMEERRLRVRIAAAPEDGKANLELRRFFAGLLGRPKGEVVLKSGGKSRLKTLSLPVEALEKLCGILENY